MLSKSSTSNDVGKLIDPASQSQRGFKTMNILIKSTFVMTVLLFIFACAEQNTVEKSTNDERVKIALSKGDESSLAETILCAGASQVLAEETTDTYPAIKKWQSSFSTIADNAVAKAMTFDDSDGAAIETRLDQIRVQTRVAIERYESQDNIDKLATFVEQTLEQCTEFSL